jgi:PKD repeat protein
MTHRLGCEAADVFAGIAPAALPLPPEVAASCQTDRPMPIVYFHGINDPTFPSADDSHATWAEINGCTGPLERVLTEGDSYCDAYQDCAGGVVTVLCSVSSGHWVYTNRDIAVADYAWDLLSPFALVAVSATFTYDIDGLTVQFSDQSAGATGWTWDFGDDSNPSIEQNPTHTYATPGTYTVTLTVTGDEGSDTTSAYITVTVPVDLEALYFLPGTAKAPGLKGSNWTTDATIVNGGTTPATYELWWLPRDEDNATPLRSGTFTLAAGASVLYNDLLGTVLSLPSRSTGAVVVASDSGDLMVMARTFNQAETGTFGQSLPGIRDEDLIPAGQRWRMIFFVENDDFRSNLGLLNGIGAPITIQWERFLPDGTSMGIGTVELPPWGNVQINRAFDAEAPVVGGYVDVWTETPAGAFAAYGSLADNQTSDPTTILPRQR